MAKRVKKPKKYTLADIEYLEQNLPINNEVLYDLLRVLQEDQTDYYSGLLIVRILKNTSPTGEYVLNDEDFGQKIFKILERGFNDCNQVELSNFRRFVWQFLYNFLVKRPAFQRQAWKNDNLRLLFLKTVIDTTHKGVKHCLSAIACLTLEKVDFDRFETHQKVQLVDTMLKAIEEDLEFALWFIQARLKMDPNSILSCYDHFDQKAKSILLDVIAELGSKVPCQVAEKCSGVFKDKAKQILTTVGGKSGPMEDVVETRKLLSLLGTYTADDRGMFRAELQLDKSLLIDCVYLIRMVQELGKEEEKNMWTPARKLSEVNQSETDKDNPVLGFKCELIQVIGNMCCGHKENQDLVRDIEGIQLILDCASIDNKNPYITQWVIFAIRNLCIDNQDNQDLLRQIDTKGVMDKKLLSETGLDVKLKF